MKVLLILLLPLTTSGNLCVESLRRTCSSSRGNLQKRLSYIQQRVATIPFLSLSPVKGSMYAFINIEKTGLDSVTFVEKLLKDTSVLMIPGKAFGETTGDHYVRLAATQSMPMLKKPLIALSSSL